MTGRTQRLPHLKPKQDKRDNEDLVILEKTGGNQVI